MKRVYIIEADLTSDEEELDMWDVLNEYDPKVKVKETRFKSFDEYEEHLHYHYVLGA